MSATKINGIEAMQRHVDAPLCLLLSLAILFASCLLHFSLSFRVLHQLAGLQPICPPLLSLSEGLRGQTSSCSLAGLRL